MTLVRDFLFNFLPPVYNNNNHTVTVLTEAELCLKHRQFIFNDPLIKSMKPPLELYNLDLHFKVTQFSHSQTFIYFSRSFKSSVVM